MILMTIFDQKQLPHEKANETLRTSSWNEFHSLHNASLLIEDFYSTNIIQGAIRESMRALKKGQLCTYSEPLHFYFVQ